MRSIPNRGGAEQLPHFIMTCPKNKTQRKAGENASPLPLTVTSNVIQFLLTTARLSNAADERLDKSDVQVIL
jgi:hypothetical protein